MASFPLQIKMTKHLLSYYCYFNAKDDDSVVKQAANMVYENASILSNSCISNLKNILKFCDLNCSNKQDFLTSNTIREVIPQLQNKYSEYWKSKINSSTRLEFFTKIKQNYKKRPISKRSEKL